LVLGAVRVDLLGPVSIADQWPDRSQGVWPWIRDQLIGDAVRSEPLQERRDV